MAWPAVLAAGIAATSSLVGDYANNRISKSQRNWQEKMWSKNNEYNTPVAQKQRLEAAGINPYSVLAGEGADTGNSSAPPSPQSNPYEFNVPFSDANSNLNMLMQLKQIEGVEYENQEKQVNAEFARITKINEIESMQEDIRNKIAERQLILSQRDLNVTEKERVQGEIDNLELRNKILDGQKDALINKSTYETRIAEIDAKNRQREYDDQHALARVKVALSNAEIRVSNAKVLAIQQEMRESVARITKMAYENKLTAQQIATEIQIGVEKMLSNEGLVMDNMSKAERTAFVGEFVQMELDLMQSQLVTNYSNSANSWAGTVANALSQYTSSVGGTVESVSYTRNNQGVVTGKTVKRAGKMSTRRSHRRR